MQLPFRISNWDVPPAHRHLGVQLTQLANAISSWVPQFVDDTIDEDVAGGELATVAPSDETPQPVGPSGSPGTSDEYARGDHVHAGTSVAPSDTSPQAVAQTADAGVATEVSRADHVHPIAEVSSSARGVLPSTSGAVDGDVATVQGDGSVAYEAPAAVIAPSVTEFQLMAADFLQPGDNAADWHNGVSAPLTADADNPSAVGCLFTPGGLEGVGFTLFTSSAQTSVEIVLYGRFVGPSSTGLTQSIDMEIWARQLAGADEFDAEFPLGSDWEDSSGGVSVVAQSPQHNWKTHLGGFTIADLPGTQHPRMAHQIELWASDHSAVAGTAANFLLLGARVRILT